jgi:hypothetical protein
MKGGETHVGCIEQTCYDEPKWGDWRPLSFVSWFLDWLDIWEF